MTHRGPFQPLLFCDSITLAGWVGSCVFASAKDWSYIVTLAVSAGYCDVVFCSPAQAAGSASGWEEAASKEDIRGGSSEGGERMCARVCVCLL